MVYDSDSNRLIVFGGWSNKYMSDLYEINISKVTGPSYAIYDIEPKLGPYTGGTQCLITGEGFLAHQTYYVSFKVGKTLMDERAQY